MQSGYGKVSSLLRIVSEIIKDGDLNQIDEALAVLKKTKESKKKASQTPSAVFSVEKGKQSAPEDFDLSALEKFESRKEAEEFIARIAIKKADLERIARQLRLPLSRREDYRELVDKIVDASVGYKLRSKAIRGGGEESEHEPETGSDHSGD